MRKHDIGFPVSHKCFALACARLNRFVRGIYDNTLAGERLTSTQLSVLMYIRESGYITAAHLRSELHMDRSTVSKHIKWLKAHELVTTEPGIDHRSRQLVLTDAGKRRVRAAYGAWRRAQEQVYELLGARLASLTDFNPSIHGISSPRTLRRGFRPEHYFRPEE